MGQVIRVALGLPWGTDRWLLGRRSFYWASSSAKPPQSTQRAPSPATRWAAAPVCGSSAPGEVWTAASATSGYGLEKPGIYQRLTQYKTRHMWSQKTARSSFTVCCLWSINGSLIDWNSVNWLICNWSFEGWSSQTKRICSLYLQTCNYFGFSTLLQIIINEYFLWQPFRRRQSKPTSYCALGCGNAKLRIFRASDLFIDPKVNNHWNERHS